MDIAVVIPVYNGAAWIGETLESVLAQSTPPREVVVVDDGSTDASAAIVKEFSDVAFVQNPGSGANAARNYGLRLTTSPLVAFVDHDDLWHPEHLALMRRALSAYPSAPAALAQVCHFRAASTPRFPAPELNPAPFDPWADYPVNTGGEPVAAVIRRESFEAAGQWPTHLDGVGDYYMWLRLALQAPLVRNRCRTVGHRVHEQSLGSSMRRDKVLAYYARHVEASEEALQHRIREGGADIERYARRLATQKAMASVLEALLDDDPERLAAAALAFETQVEAESAAFVWKLWSQLGWYVQPHLHSRLASGGPLFYCKTLEWLRHWPAEASRTGTILRTEVERRIVGRAALYLLATKPWRMRHWHWAFRWLWRRISTAVENHRMVVTSFS